MFRLGILCSGKLGFETLSKILNSNLGDIVFVLTDSNSTRVINFLKNKKIPFFAGNPRGGAGYDFIKTLEVDVIISVNYLFLIEEDIINHAKTLSFNIHGSLLPKYRGRTPHVWAIINGETLAGITAHVIDKGCDTGQIIHQIEVEIGPEDSGATILDKYTGLYFPLIKKVIDDLYLNQLNLRDQNNEDATYFGKRTPDDGEIDWNWPKEQIKNWIRAQAHPYPGAFTFYNNQKVIIDEVFVNNRKILENQENGTLLSVSPNLVVKTSSGVVNIVSMRAKNCIFEIGKKFENENSE